MLKADLFMTNRHSFFRPLLWLPALTVLNFSAFAEPLHLELQSRVPVASGSNEFRIVKKSESWEPSRTAIIVCDMWDLHSCLNAVRRVQQMAPRMNQLLEVARRNGVLIIHAPSDCMNAYAGHPARLRAQQAPLATNLPPDMSSKACKKIPSEEGAEFNLSQVAANADDDPVEHANWAAALKAKGLKPQAPWTREIHTLRIDDADAISDSGVEIWNLLEARGITNVILMGVHLNVCICARPFGLRQMRKNGKHVVLMRDLTDSMYSPKDWPYVDHYRGTALFVEYIEKYIAPTITSDQILGGRPFVFKGDPGKGQESAPKINPPKNTEVQSSG